MSVGILIGVVAALFLATFLASVLYGVAARRASRVDPLEALRYE